MVNVEALIIAWGNENDLIGAPFHANVPADRPPRFFTVERTGGASERYRDMPMVAVQAWAETRSEASKLMNQELVPALWSELHFHPRISRIIINTIANFPGPDGEPRYQALLEIVTS